VKDKKLLKKNRLHFVGIGGIGMSGIARVLLEMGYKISGSDAEPNSITGKLERMGGRICHGHNASNLPCDAEVLVYSSSISEDNPELREARRRKIRIAHRAEVLAELFNNRKGIAVTGTHGKTTTSSLIAVMLKDAGLDPTIIVGGEIDSLKGNALLGAGRHIVAEADESDSSFLHLKPFYTAITNVEMEHLDHFKTMVRIKAAYRRFIDNTKKGGVLFYNAEDANLMTIIGGYKGKKRSFGFSEKADISARNIKMNGFNTSFDCMRGGKCLGKVLLKIPGRHNVLNALMAILVGLELGLKFKDIAKAVKGFEGARRRFQLKADVGGVMLIDDYAHHPTEIRSALEASRNWKKGRLIVIFQPHRYSRTKFFADDFAGAFKEADKLILADIYAASEKAIKGVTIDRLCDKIRANGLKDVAAMEKGRIAEHVMNIKKPGDMIIIMGAGDIKKVADELCGRLLLPGAVEGGIRFNEPLSEHTSFKIGGCADIWFEPKDVSDLRSGIFFAKEHSLRFFIIGNGSNILAADKGFGGMLIHLGSDYFKKVKTSGNTICVGAGFSLPKLVNICCRQGIAGLESMVGIPGTVGGAIYMNAGGWTNPIFRNIGEAVESLKVMDRDGKIKRLRKAELKFDYRCSNLGDNIILEVILKLRRGNKGALISSASHFLKMKKEKQVLDIPSAGCVFKNPPDSQFTCGQMIDTLGLKGRRIGGAEISPRHANFIVNRGGATCRDVLDLADLARAKVKENYDISLELEVKII
jgi:UDP-N-acetylmuramate--L-alanine ligase/UDP-N-acetylenolpyruvoylglucosamine reductase